MASPTERMKYRDFWPFYVREHSKPLTRHLHFIGTLLVIFFAVLGFMVSSHWFWAMPIGGYFFAWTSHFFIEKNRPATFKYPLFSLIADFQMFFMILIGRMDAEVEKLRAK